MRTAVNCLLFLASFSAQAFLNSIENRMTYPEFVAKKLNGVPQALSLYSAAGKFSCNDTWESGTIVGRNDIVVIAAHSIKTERKGQCVLKSALGKCYFQTIKVDGSFGRKIQIDPQTLTISSNYRCSENTNEMDRDWAVVKLKSQVQEVQGFEFEEASTRLKGTSVYVFASHSTNFTQQGTPTICLGKIGFVWRFDSFAFGTDCSSGPGSSGGAVVAIDQSSPKYVGLISISTDDAKDAKLDLSNFSGGPLVTDEFYRALFDKVSTPVVSK